MKKRRVVIIGAGHVGAHVASALMLQDICEEIVLLDIDKGKAACHAEDMQDAACYAGKRTRIRAGGYEDCEAADICVLSYCGAIFEEDRLEELDVALDIADEIIPRLQASGFHGILVSITNPCDLVALYYQMHSGFPVVGTGTALDSARFRVRIGQQLSMAPSGIEAFCVGEHGNSQVPVWSQVRIGGRTLTDLSKEQPEVYGNIDKKQVEDSTIHAGWNIVTGKGSTEYGIGAAAAELIRVILTDSRQVLPCSYEYRRSADSPVIYTSIPSVIGAAGVIGRMEPQLTKEEAGRFEESCLLLEQYRKQRLETRK